MRMIARILLVYFLIMTSSVQSITEEEELKLKQASVKIQEIIAARWKPGIHMNSMLAIARFEVNEDGTIANLQMIQKSGDYNYDVNCLKTIINSAPFFPISKWMEVEYKFEYNLGTKNLFSKTYLPPTQYDPNQPYSLELFEESVAKITRSKNTSIKTDQSSKQKPTDSEKASITINDMKTISEFKLNFPLNCKLNQDCFVTMYPDHAQEGKDFSCERLSSPNLRGTLISLRNAKLLYDPGIEVVAVADGTVLEVSNGFEDDYSFTLEQQNDSCGNSVVIEHENNFRTTYCHLKKSSVLVNPGQKINRGDVIAKLGASGSTSQPQLYFGLSYKSIAIDPFTATDLNTPCSQAGKTYTKSMWQNHISYRQSGIREVGIADAEPELKDIWANKYPNNSVASNSKALVFWVHIFGQEIGDKEQMKIYKPDGALFFDKTRIITANYRDALSFAGEHRQNYNFQKGLWKAVYILERDSKTVLESNYSFRVD
jgi:murein DD-endopeptidase